MLENEQSILEKAIPQLPLIAKDEIHISKYFMENSELASILVSLSCSIQRWFHEMKLLSNTMHMHLFSNDLWQTLWMFMMMKEVSTPLDLAYKEIQHGLAGWTKKWKNPPSKYKDFGDDQHWKLYHKSNHHLEMGKTYKFWMKVSKNYLHLSCEDPSYHFLINYALLYSGKKSIFLHNITIVSCDGMMIKHWADNWECVLLWFYEIKIFSQLIVPFV